MPTDRQGHPLAGSTDEAAGLYDQAVEAFNLYRGDPIALLDRALEASPRLAMATILKAWLYALATEPEAGAEAVRLLAGLEGQPLGAREASHRAALGHLIAGDWKIGRAHV